MSGYTEQEILGKNLDLLQDQILIRKQWPMSSQIQVPLTELSKEKIKEK
jgi:hypothetical protein